MAQPEAGRPHVPDYGIPTSLEGTLDWSHVKERMAASRNYWICTASAHGRPHAVPVWGVWVSGTLHFGGGPDTRWSRDLRANPRIAVHLENGDEVTVIEGTVDEHITDVADPRLEAIDDAYEAKYNMRHGPIIRILTPRLAFAWTQFPTDATRWRFG